MSSRTRTARLALTVIALCALAGCSRDVTFTLKYRDTRGLAAGSPVNWTPAATLANQITTDMVGDVTLALGNYLSGVLQSTVLLTFPLNVPASYVPTIASAPSTS